MNGRLLSCVLAVAACSPELPSLPTADEDAPSQIQWVALEMVEGGEAIALVEIDQQIGADVMDELRGLAQVVRADLLHFS